MSNENYVNCSTCGKEVHIEESQEHVYASVLIEFIQAAEARENVMGDPISLSDAKHRLRMAVKKAREVLNMPVTKEIYNV